MLSQELKSIHTVMGCLLLRVDPESAELVRLCRRNLEASADMADNMERTMIAQVDATSSLVDRPPLRHETNARRV